MKIYKASISKQFTEKDLKDMLKEGANVGTEDLIKDILGDELFNTIEGMVLHPATYDFTFEVIEEKGGKNGHKS